MSRSKRSGCVSWFPSVMVVVCAGFVLLAPTAASAQEGPPLAGAVGIRVTPTGARPQSLEADLDLTMYTRVGPYPSTYAGVPTFNLPAIDYGDGGTLSTTTLVLASSGGGPGGSNVYRNLASFTHTYPAAGAYTVRSASYCTACFRSQYVFFPAGSPAPSIFTSTWDYMPGTVIGNLAARYAYSGTYTYSDVAIRYIFTFYGAVTNTAQVNLQQAEAIPAASPWGLAILSGLLLLAGVAILRLT